MDEVEELKVQVLKTRRMIHDAELTEPLTSVNNLAFTFKGWGQDTEDTSLTGDYVKLRQRILGLEFSRLPSSSTRPTETGGQAK